MFQKFRPLGDRVLVKRLESEEKTQSGIIIPDAAKEKAQTGAVVAVGMGRKDNSGKQIPMDVKVGDVVYFGKYSGTDLNSSAGDYIIVREEEILGIVER